MIPMYGIHRMRKKNVVRYSFHVLDSDLPSRYAADLGVVFNERSYLCFGQYFLSC
jgi:hypothetical protein